MVHHTSFLSRQHGVLASFLFGACTVQTNICLLSNFVATVGVILPSLQSPVVSYVNVSHLPCWGGLFFHSAACPVTSVIASASQGAPHADFDIIPHSTGLVGQGIQSDQFTDKSNWDINP